MRRLLVVLAATGALAVGAAPAGAVPRHVHSITTPNGNTHSIGRGVSFNAPCTAFLNLHGNVHLGAFAGNNPLPISAELIEGTC